jgi:DDE superfamily endonuclease
MGIRDEDGGISTKFMMELGAAVAALAAVGSVAKERAPSMFEQRLSWEAIRDRHSNRSNFTRHLRMSLESFEQLLGYIRPSLVVNEEMAARRGGAILPEICLYCTIRWLAGGSYSDIYLFAGISTASFYRVVWKTLKAIIVCPELQMKFPSTIEECKEAANGFFSVSYGGAITHCVSVIDGYLLEITTPPKDKVNCVRAYFSGHYQRNGVNIQAACDHMSRFQFFGVAGPGVTNDSIAYTDECELGDLVEALPVGFVAIGDAAYRSTEHMVSMYSGLDRKKKKYDNFNYFASQCRIRIEMAFGMMYRKWGILWRPLSIDIGSVRILALAIAMLHNYCINERIRLSRNLNVDPVADDGIIGRGGDHEAYFVEDAEVQALECFPGHSTIREKMAEYIEELGLERRT